jgi:Na+-transporting NADH:ubiquinone oxidoreductase subunit NqrB
LGIFWALGELGGFRGILIVGYNRAFSVKYSKNMGISGSQNVFHPIFQVIYHKKYTYIAENLPHFWGISCIFGEF